MSAPVVVKVGGSLFDWPDLGPRLRAFLDTLKPPILIVAILYTALMFGVWQWSVPAGLWMFGLLSVVLALVAEPQ